MKKSLINYKLCQSLDAPTSEDGDATLGTLLKDNNVDQPDHEVAIRESQKIEGATATQSFASSSSRSRSYVLRYRKEISCVFDRYFCTYRD